MYLQYMYTSSDHVLSIHPAMTNHDMDISHDDPGGKNALLALKYICVVGFEYTQW